jgi:DNA-binding MarR family transcriptional regulator
MSVETREPTADATPAPVTAADVEALSEAMRNLMIQAKNRHKQMDKSGQHGRIAVLVLLSRLGRMRPSAIAKELSLDLSTVSRHLRALEDEGRLAKTADPDDKRAFQVGLTERGDALMEEYWQARVAIFMEALTDWNGEDVRTLATLLDRFVRDTEGCFK